MVAFISELVARPGKSAHVCEAFDTLRKEPDWADVQHVSAVAADEPRRIMVLHMLTPQQDDKRFESEVLPRVLESLAESLDYAPRLRRFDIVGDDPGTALPRFASTQFPI